MLNAQKLTLIIINKMLTVSGIVLLAQVIHCIL